MAIRSKSQVQFNDSAPSAVFFKNTMPTVATPVRAKPLLSRSKRSSRQHHLLSRRFPSYDVHLPQSVELGWQAA